MIPVSRKAAAAAQRRARAAAVRQHKAAAEETRAEAIAPAVQRHDTLDAAGQVVRHARLERDGLTFRRSNPVRHLVARGGPMIRKAHEIAADRLVVSWEEGGRGVGIAATAYGERAGGGLEVGSLPPYLLARMAYQHRQKAAYEGARIWLGGLWPIIDAVVLRGIDVSAYARPLGQSRQVMLGYLAAALDRLVEFYAQTDRPAKGIRAVVVAKRVDSDAAS